MSSFTLEGKNCVVTGGARGMGNAIARAYAEANANGIALIDVRDDLGQNELEELRAAYPKTHFEYYHLDISDYEEVGKVYQSIKKDFGTVNVQVSCAGIATYVDSLELTPETWHKVMRVNLDGTFWTAQAAARLMKEQGTGGSVVIIGSISAHVVNRPDTQPGLASYCISKGADVHMAKVLGVDWARHNIRVNSISPGNIKTPLAPTDKDSLDFFNYYTPMGRMGLPEEIAKPAVYLASDASSFQTSTDILVDGGLAAW